MSISLLRHLYWKLRYSNRFDFIRMSLGISARARRCAPYWKRHLNTSKGFVNSNLHSADTDRPDAAAVLGSGHLLDVDLTTLLERYEYIDLYDANPVCQTAHVHHLSSTEDLARVGFIECDLTGCIDSWTEGLSSFLTHHRPDNTHVDLCQHIQHLKAPQRRLERDYAIVISLNLLSQIPIYWRDRVQHLLKRYWRLDSDDNGFYHRPLQTAIESSMAALQKAHLELIFQSAAERVLLIFDDAFWYYLADDFRWQRSEAVYIDVRGMNGYELIDERSWWWDIAPPGVEQADYGCVHSVCAQAFQRTGATSK